MGLGALFFLLLKNKQPNREAELQYSKGGRSSTAYGDTAWEPTLVQRSWCPVAEESYGTGPTHPIPGSQHCRMSLHGDFRSCVQAHLIPCSQGRVGASPGQGCGQEGL